MVYWKENGYFMLRIKLCHFLPFGGRKFGAHKLVLTLYFLPCCTSRLDSKVERSYGTDQGKFYQRLIYAVALVSLA